MKNLPASAQTFFTKKGTFLSSVDPRPPKVTMQVANVECRMSNVVRKRLEPCQKSLQRLSDIALWGKKKEKGKMKSSAREKNEGQSDMGENNGAPRNPLNTCAVLVALDQNVFFFARMCLKRISEKTNIAQPK